MTDNATVRGPGSVRDISDLLSGHPFLSGSPEELVARLAGCARNVVIPAGALLLAEGQEADTLYLIRRGEVALEVWAPGRGTLVIETLGEGQVVGWSWLLPPYRWHFDVRARNRVVALSIDASCLREKAEADPRFGYELMKRFAEVIVDRLQATRFRLLDLYSGVGGGPPARLRGSAEEGRP